MVVGLSCLAARSSVARGWRDDDARLDHCRADPVRLTDLALAHPDRVGVLHLVCAGELVGAGDADAASGAGGAAGEITYDSELRKLKASDVLNQSALLAQKMQALRAQV